MNSFTYLVHGKGVDLERGTALLLRLPSKQIVLAHLTLVLKPIMAEQAFLMILNHRLLSLAMITTLIILLAKIKGGL